MLIILRK